MKKKAVLLLVGILTVFLSACGSNESAEAVKQSEEIEKQGKSSDSEEQEAEIEEPEEEAEKVGILLPEETDQEFLRQKFEEKGYKPEILIAGNDADKQIEQFQTLVEEEVAAIVADPVDAYNMSEALTLAEEKEIPVFSYDTLIMNSEFVKYYATFDTRASGRLVGESIVTMKELEKAREEKLSYTIEFLMGTPEDTSELFFYNGILEVLQEYLDDGTLVCKSGKVSFDDTSVMRGSEITAKNKLQSILDEFYAEEGTPDIICTSSDKYTYAVMELLDSREIDAESGSLPLITGCGSEAAAVKNVAEGKLGFTLFEDRSELADICVKMVDTYLAGESAEVDNYSQYDNGKKIIGTYTCDSKLIDKDNYQIMIDNGTYRDEEIMPEILTPTPEPTETASEGETSEETEKGEALTGTPVPEEASDAEIAGTPVPENEAGASL